MTATKLEPVFSGLLILGFVAFMALIAAGFALPSGQFGVLVPYGFALIILELVFMCGARWARSRAEHVLENIDYRMCPYCRYILTGLGDEGRCPECSARFEAEWLKHIWTVRYNEKPEKWSNTDA